MRRMMLNAFNGRYLNPSILTCGRRWFGRQDRLVMLKKKAHGRQKHVPPGRRRYKMSLQNVASLDGGGAGAGAEMREKFGEFLRIGDGREARAGRADKGLRFFRMSRRQHFPQSARQGFEVRFRSHAQHGSSKTIKKRGGSLQLPGRFVFARSRDHNLQGRSEERRVGQEERSR